ncbi:MULTISPECIES: general secretion pathway protein GspK [Acidovorax]|jgi:general secretion pathway protein K|uniref:general secretion pathway protein GspK n=1 Tax=Acidovorax TaxID=12916 RepID=UPI0009E6C080|nr:general secretion pathway protein GspK [Acidovorax sp. Root402]
MARDSVNLPVRSQRGMALLAVLWIVAALSIIATGTMRTVRTESRAIVQARQQVEAQALGDGAIQMALQALVANNQPLTKATLTEIAYRNVTMQVQSMPLNGLIDINMAGLPLLERLLSVAGGLPAEAAQATAQAIVQTRMRRDPRGGPQRFEAEEDLLRVPGVDYDLYAKLEGVLTADLQGSGRVNPLAAPVEVLAVLAGGNTAAAAQIAMARDAGQTGVDTTALDGSLLDASVSRRVRVQARVPLADGGYVRVSRSVDLNARTPNGAPWHTFRTAVRLEPRKS